MADDEPHVVDYLSTLLEMEGFVVVGTAADADGAVQLAHRLEPDVALLDLRMPGGGLEAARLIGSLSPTTKIVIFSSAADESDLVPLLRAGHRRLRGEGEPARPAGRGHQRRARRRGLPGPAGEPVRDGAAVEPAPRRGAGGDAEPAAAAADRRGDLAVDASRWCSSRSSTCTATSRWRPRRSPASTSGAARPPQWLADADPAGLLVPLELALAPRRPGRAAATSTAASRWR